MSWVPQAKGGAKSNLAKALAAGTRAAGRASGRTSDKGRSHSRSRSAQGCATSRCLETRHCAEPPLDVRREAPKIQREWFVRQRPRRIPQPRAGCVFQNKISRLEAFHASVAAQASGARGVGDVAGAGHYGKWKGNLARDVRRRAFLKDVDKPNVYWARIPFKDLATGAAKTPTWCPFLLVHEMLASLAEKHARDVSSFTAIPQQLWSMKRNFCANHRHQ